MVESATPKMVTADLNLYRDTLRMITFHVKERLCQRIRTLSRSMALKTAGASGCIASAGEILTTRTTAKRAPKSANMEAMAREKIVIASNNLGNADLIKHGENGFLFENNNAEDLAHKIKLALKQKNKKLQKNAKTSVEQFSWDKVMKKIEEIL